MDSDFVVGINKSIDAAKGETGQTYPAYLHNTLVTKKLDELAEAITEGGGGASALSDLEDVDISGTVQGGKVLKYNAVEEKWAPGDDSGNVQSDWNESDPASGAYILNKPDIDAKMNKINASGVGSFSLNRAVNTTIGNNSFAEGNICTASGTQSHAEGLQTVASGASSHAEGVYSTASGNESHAEGMNTTASGDNSHAEGNHTIAAGDNQHVSGKYNIEDSNDTYAEIVGNGTSNNIRSNARTLDWSGNESLAGNIDAAGFGSRLAALVPNSYIELTQAEYDALTPAEKMSDTPYLITDANGDGSQFQPVIYSTSERVIGVWTDGKPLYEKTVVLSSELTINANDWGVTSEPSSGISSLIDMVVLSSTGTVYLAYGAIDTGDYIRIYNVRSNAEIRIKTFIIRYTKTTDTPGSGIWTPQGVPAVHYSTDEQVVGTWIDGSPVYEKTISIDNISGTSYETSALGLNISKLVSFFAYIHLGSDGGYGWITTPHTEYAQRTYKLDCWYQSGDDKIHIQSDWGLSGAIIVVRYTKSST